MMNKVKLIIKGMLFTMAILLALMGAFLLFNGSLEMNPTEEQSGKAAIAAVMLILMGGVLGTAGFFIRNNAESPKTSKRKYVKKAFLLFGLLFMCLFATPMLSKADFGDFSGDSDYGGGSYDSGWSSSSYDSYSSYGSYGSSDDDDFDAIDAVVVIIIVIMIISSILKNKNKGGYSGARNAGASETLSSNLRPMDQYLQLDPNFDEAKFREHLSNLYIQMQQCWHEKNIESIKPYFTDAFYNQCDRQLEQKRRANQTPYTERIAVLEVTPRGFYQSQDHSGQGTGMDHIVVRMRTRIVDYTLDDATGRVISGDRQREKFMTYEWDLCRKSGVITSVKGGVQSITCPHCGAPLDINQTAKCPYCGSVVTVVNEDWALNNIKGIAQQTR